MCSYRDYVFGAPLYRREMERSEMCEACQQEPRHFGDHSGWRQYVRSHLHTPGVITGAERHVKSFSARQMPPIKQKVPLQIQACNIGLQLRCIRDIGE